ncbi:MAG: HEPN domain-containing protein [Defluviitaleaceae bacterium]|nr:HEPN domain-containing protein [Defluviitaleaceae bacterium]MCL2274170.1 HEPN domain-containing protein [Defluviitaleaceae bacterium]
MRDFDVVKEWLRYAQRDYDIALHLNESFHPLPVENICYNCQQAIEKALKGVLILMVGDYPKTHDIRELHQLCKEAGVDFTLQPSATRTLTRFATKSRYPDDVYDFTEADAEMGLKYAKQVLTQAKEVLDKTE